MSFLKDSLRKSHFSPQQYIFSRVIWLCWTTHNAVGHTAQALLPAVFRLRLNHSITRHTSKVIPNTAADSCPRERARGERHTFKPQVEISGLYNTYYRGKYYISPQEKKIWQQSIMECSLPETGLFRR